MDASAAPRPSPSPTPAPLVDAAIAYQIDPAHSGSQPSDSLVPGLVKKYVETCQWDVSYPLIAGGRIFYLCGAVLTAVDQATGNFAFPSKYFYPNHGWSAIAYDGGRVFDLLDSGQLTAIDAATGSQVWQVQLPNNVSFTSPPTAVNGVIYTGGAGTGSVYAVSESSGQVLWTAPVSGGYISSPAVSSTGVYVSYRCGQTYAFNPTSGALLWQHGGSCTGTSGRTPILFGGKLCP